MSRVPYPDWAKLSQEKRDAVGYPDRPVLNVTRLALSAADGLWRANYAFKRAMIYDTTIDQRLREVLILRVAQLTHCEYELHHHISISANLGFAPAQQQALLAGDYSGFSAKERTVAEFTDEVVANEGVSDTTLEKMRDFFGDSIVVEMMVIIGSYVGTALIANAVQLEPDTEPVRSWDAPSGKA